MTKRLGLYLGNRTSDRHQISKTNPSEGKDYVTASISTFIKCGIWSLFANPVTYINNEHIKELHVDNPVQPGRVGRELLGPHGGIASPQRDGQSLE